MVLITQRLCVLATKEEYDDGHITICSANQSQSCQGYGPSKTYGRKERSGACEKGRKTAQSSASQVRKLVKATGKKAASGQKTARAKARKAGAAIGKILGRAQGLSRKLVNKAKRRLTY